MQCGACDKPIVGDYWFHTRLRSAVHPSHECMQDLKGEDVRRHTMVLIIEPRDELGRIAYETYMDYTRGTEVADLIYPAWDCLHNIQREAWRQAASAVRNFRSTE